MGGKQKLAIGETEEDEKKSLLPSTPHCKLNNMPDDVFQMVVGYVQKYFTCYDGDRQGLLGAYNQKCIFSLCLNMSNAVAHRSFKFEDILIKDNRNLKRIVGGEDYHFDKRAKLLHIGYIDTVNFLCKLPATEHEPSSFKLDNCFFSNNLITFSLSGVFKEGKSTDKVRPLRSFHRVFTCIPDPNSQAPAQSANTIQNQPESTTLSTNIPTQAIPTELVGLSEQQILMAKEFSAKSRLNLEWSKHCLDHSKWIFDDAANAFMQFKESIPKEAYLA